MFLNLKRNGLRVFICGGEDKTYYNLNIKSQTAPEELEECSEIDTLISREDLLILHGMLTTFIDNTN